MRQKARTKILGGPTIYISNRMIEFEFTYSLLCQATIIAGVEQMNKVRVKANHIGNERERAITFHDEVVSLMEEIRKHVDDLEMVVDDELWTLPKYREMLFIH